MTHPAKRIPKAVPPQRTLSVDVSATDEQRDLFLRTVGVYNKAWGDVVAWCKKNKSVNRTTLQEDMYHVLRKRYPELPSQFVSCVLRDGAAAVKSWNSNNKGKKWRIKAKRKRLTLPYDLRIMSLRGNLLGFSTLHKEKRQRFLLAVPAWFDQRNPVRELNAAKVTVTETGLRLNLVYRIPETTNRSRGKTVGVDRGIVALVTTSKGGEYKSSEVRGLRRKYTHVRKTLQEKGTRSAKRRLKSIAGREARFVRDVNHVVSKNLASDPDVREYVLEDLKMSDRKRRRNSKKNHRKNLNGWSYFQFQTFLEYKCRSNGIQVHYVSPAYTSQRCNVCGFIDRRNRDGSRFDCRRCKHSDDADHNASKNIRDKYLSIGG